MDSSLADLSLVFRKKFDHFLPTLFHNRIRLLKKGEFYTLRLITYQTLN